MRSRSFWLMLGCLAVSACGSGGSGHAAASSHTGTTSGAGRTSSRAAQLVIDSARALRAAKSYVLQGTMTENGVPLRLKIIVAGRADLALSFATGATSTQLLLISHSAYLRATKAFWQAHLGARGAALANRWIEVPPTSTGAITASLGPFAPTTLARCLVEDHGTLSIAGRTTIAGRPATLVRDAGDAPGAAPGTLAVAAAGTPYPLQFRATGPQRPGGPIDVCNDGKGIDTRGTATFSHFGSVPPLRPPSRSVRLHPSASA